MRFLFLCFTVFLFYHCNQQTRQILPYDVVIVGGGASGSMAGIQSARLGSNTLVIEETPWLGGMLTTAGVSAIDGNYRLHSGLWYEFKQQLASHYGGEDSLKTGWVSNVLFEPDVGAHILLKMASAENRLNIWFNTSLKSIEQIDKNWQLVVLEDGKEKTIVAKVVIDGTELGDVSKLVGIPYDIGMDSGLETGEEIAPIKANDIIQDMTYVAILKDYGNKDHLIEKPPEYNPSLFYCTCSGRCDQDTISRKLWGCDQLMNYGKLPNDKYMINWPIYGNDYYVNAIELDKEERELAFKQAKWFTKCYVYYLQNELDFKHLGIADDVFPTKDGFPFMPYHRESRRIQGIVRFDINDLANPFEQKDALYRTGIAVGDYPVDHHHAAYPESEKLPDLYFYPVPSYSLPLGTLIPKFTTNFIVAEKSISVTNLVNGTTRLQPVCLLVGQAAGVLAHLSVAQGVSPSEIPVRDVQDILIENGAYIMPYSDITPADPAFNSVQRIGATGILKGEGKNIGWENHTLFHPDSLLMYATLNDGIMEYENDFVFKIAEQTITVEKAIELISNLRDQSTPLRSQDIEKTWNEYQLGPFDMKHAISRKQFAVLLDKMVDPFHSKSIDHFGNFVN